MIELGAQEAFVANFLRRAISSGAGNPILQQIPGSRSPVVTTSPLDLASPGDLGAEPRRICLVGCEPETLESLGDAQFGLSEPVQRAAEAAVERIEAMLRENSAAKGDQA
jgi:hypothetical protein